MKNQVNVLPSKISNKALITDTKEMEIYELSNKEVNMIFSEKFSEL